MRWYVDPTGRITIRTQKKRGPLGLAGYCAHSLVSRGPASIFGQKRTEIPPTMRFGGFTTATSSRVPAWSEAS